jgi:GNAT superfamily N-acetyltransferase
MSNCPELTKVQFIPYTENYRDELITLHRSALNGISHGLTQEEEERDLYNITGTYQGEHGVFLIGVNEGHLVAMGGFKIIGNGIAELKRMRIVSDRQGSGIGSKLLQRLETLAVKKDIHKLVLETATSRTKTLTFYDKHGYQRTGKGRYGAQPTITFEKKL